jgi:hypothetical protein
MQFQVQDAVRHPRSAVFAAHRDRIEDIARHLSDVERIEVRGRARHADGREVQTQWWTGSTSALPVLVRPLVPPALLQWRQQTTWDATRWAADWEIEVAGIGPAIVARGRHLYLEDSPVGCRIDLTGDFEFHPERVPQLAQVPASAVPMVEKAVISLIVPMIKRTGAAVARFLDEEAARG